MTNQFNMPDEDYAIYQAEYDLWLDGNLPNTLMDTIREQNKIEQFKHDLRRQAALLRIQNLRKTMKQSE